MFYRFLIPHRWRSGSRSGSRSGLKKYCSDARNSLMWFHCESVGGRFMSARLGYLWGLCLDFCNESDANVLETQHHLKVRDKRGSFSSRPKRFKKKKTVFDSEFILLRCFLPRQNGWVCVELVLRHQLWVSVVSVPQRWFWSYRKVTSPRQRPTAGSHPSVRPSTLMRRHSHSTHAQITGHQFFTGNGWKKNIVWIFSSPFLWFPTNPSSSLSCERSGRKRCK